MLDVGVGQAGMAPGQVVQGGHSTIIASGLRSFPHARSITSTGAPPPGGGRAGPRPGYGAAWCPAGPDHDGLVDLASNDYLGLCGDPRLTAAAVEAAREWGTGSTGSRLVTGTTALHARLEARLAEFAGAAAALVFSSGYLANLTVLTALAAAAGGAGADGVLIVSDAGNHASLIDACRLVAPRSARVRVDGDPAP